MAGRNWVMAVTVASALVLGACGSDESSGDQSEVTAADDGGASAAIDAGGGAIDTVAGGGATSDTLAADDASSDTLAAADDGSSTDSGDEVVGDPTLFALTQLTVDAACALLPKDQVEGIVGAAVAAPTGMEISSLGVNCLYTDATTLDLVAKLEFNRIPWTGVVGLTSYPAEGVPKAEDCTVGGRRALCTPAYELGGSSIGAQVYVQLGGDDDITLFTESSKGLDIATQLAEQALANVNA